jgi:hypothetical protein
MPPVECYHITHFVEDEVYGALFVVGGDDDGKGFVHELQVRFHKRRRYAGFSNLPEMPEMYRLKILTKNTCPGENLFRVDLVSPLKSIA